MKQKNQKQTYQLKSRPQIWPSDLILAMALTLNFQGQIWIMLYFSQKWCDCQEMKSKHFDWTQELNDHQVWPWLWPWKLRFNSSWPSATYMRHNFQCLFSQRPRYVALISVLISPVPHIWDVTNGSLLASPPNSHHSPASLISPVPHICGASQTPILIRVVWKILNVVTKILVVLPDYRLP